MNIIDSVKNFFRQDRATVLPNKSGIDPWSAYQGAFSKPLLSTRTDPQGQDNILLPLIAQIVDTSTAALLGDGIKLDVQGDGDEAAQAFLDQFAVRSRLSTTVQKAALNGAVQGHIFVKIVIENGFPHRFQAINSANVTAQTEDRDCECVLSYTVTWESPSQDGHRTDKHREITRRDGDTWMIEEYISPGGSGRWNLVSSIAWPFSWAPIFDAPNLIDPTQFWGKPDATAAVIAQNQAINTTLSLLSRLLRNHANPKTIITGLNSRSVDWLLDGAVSLPEGVTADQLEMTASGAGALLELYKTLREALHTTSRTPEVASGKLENLGAISGTALSILFRPLTEKTAEKRLHLGAMLEELAMRVLELGGFPGRTVKVVWPDTTPKSQIEERQVGQIDQQLGVVSKETLAKSLGYNWETEQEQMVAEGVNAGEEILAALDRG
jgi:hypothetical protein